MAIEFDLTDEELATANLASLTVGLTPAEKVEWAYRYTHRAANLQGKLVAAYNLPELPHLGQGIPIPAAVKAAWKAEINALATRCVQAQTAVQNITD